MQTTMNLAIFIFLLLPALLNHPNPQKSDNFHHKAHHIKFYLKARQLTFIAIKS